MNSVTLLVDFEKLVKWSESEERQIEKQKEKALIEKLDGKEFDINGYIVECSNNTLKIRTTIDNTKIGASAFINYGNKEMCWHVYYPTRVVNFIEIEKIPKKFRVDCVKMAEAINSLRKFE